MCLGKLRQEIKGISPLVTILLLIAIAVAASGMSFSWIMSLQSSQYTQAQTQVRIEMVQWDVSIDKVTVTVRNTGSIEATIESVSVRKNVPGSTYIICTDGLPITLQVQSKTDILWDAGLLEKKTSYVIKITTTTGFYYELSTASPST